MEIETKNAGSIKRFFAATIDAIIANTIRVIVFTLLSGLWLKKQIKIFYGQFQDKFNSNFIGNDPEKIQFVAQHSIIKSVLLFLFIVFVSGALYYAFLNSSRWRATIGKKIMKIIIIKDDGEKLGLFGALSHYLLSFIPWIFAFYIFAYSMINRINIYEAISNNYFNLTFGLITVFWMQIHVIFKKKKTAADFICKVKVVEKL